MTYDNFRAIGATDEELAELARLDRQEQKEIDNYLHADTFDWKETREFCGMDTDAENSYARALKYH